MYNGKIQQWQTDTNSSDLLLMKAGYDIMQYLLLNHQVPPEDVRQFVCDASRDVLVFGNIDWNDCPNKEFVELWEHKHRCLRDLYQTITNIYSCYVPNQYFSDMYREKFDQSVDVMVDSTAPAPLIDTPATSNVVVIERSKWGRLMVLLETYRVSGKHRILSSDTVVNTNGSLDCIREQLFHEVNHGY